MKRIVVRLSGMPFDPTYEIDDDTVAIGDLVLSLLFNPSACGFSSRTGLA